MENKFICPNCKSENIQKASVVFRAGTTDSSSVGIGGIFGSESAYGGVNVTQGISQTRLAQEFAHPQKYRVFWRILFFIYMAMLIIPADCAFIYAVLTGEMQKAVTLDKLILLILVLCVLNFIVFKIFNDVKKRIKANKNYSKDLENWNKTWYCHKCENVFKIY